MSSNNVINRIILDLDFESELAFKAFTDELELQNEFFLEVIEEVFHNLPSNRNLYLEKVELELSSKSIHLINDFKKEVKEQLIKYLSDLFMGTRNTSGYSLLQTIKYFIEEGRLPWWITNYAALEKAVLKITNLTSNEVNKILRLLLKSEQSFYRLKQMLTSQSYHHLLSVLLGKRKWAKINRLAKTINTSLVLDSAEKQHSNYLLIKESSKLQLLAKEEKNSYNAYLFKLLTSKKGRSTTSILDITNGSASQLNEHLIDLLVNFIKGEEIDQEAIGLGFLFSKTRNSNLLINTLSKKNALNDENSIIRLFTAVEEDSTILLYRIISEKAGKQFAQLFRLLVIENSSLLTTADYIQFAFSFIKVSDSPKPFHKLVADLVDRLLLKHTSEVLLLKLPASTDKSVTCFEEAILKKITTANILESNTTGTNYYLITGLIESIKAQLTAIYGNENIEDLNSIYTTKRNTPSAIIKAALSQYSKKRRIDLATIYQQTLFNLTKNKQINYFEQSIIQYLNQQSEINKLESINKVLIQKNIKPTQKDVDLIQFILEVLNDSTTSNQQLKIESFSIRGFLNKTENGGGGTINLVSLMKQLGLSSNASKQAAYALWLSLSKKPSWSKKDQALLSLLAQYFPLHTYSPGRQQKLKNIGKLLFNPSKTSEYLQLIPLNLTVVSTLEEPEYIALVKTITTNSAVYLIYKKLYRMLVAMGFRMLISGLKIELIRLFLGNKKTYSTRKITNLLLQFLQQTSPELKHKLTLTAEIKSPSIKNMSNGEELEAITLLILIDELLKPNNKHSSFETIFKQQIDKIKKVEATKNMAELAVQKEQSWELLWATILDSAEKVTKPISATYKKELTQAFGKDEEAAALIEKILASKLTQKEKLVIANSIKEIGNQLSLEDAILERLFAFIFTQLPKNKINSSKKFAVIDAKGLKALSKLIRGTEQKAKQSLWDNELTTENNSESLITYLVDDLQFITMLDVSNYTSINADEIRSQLKKAAKSSTEITLIELLKGLRINKLSSQKIITNLWQELKSKKAFNKKDRIALKEVSTALIELYVPIRNRRETAKMLNELLLVMAKYNEPAATVNTLLKHQKMIPLINEAVFKNLISAITPIDKTKVLSIYDRMVALINDSGQLELLNVLKYSFLRIAQNYKNSLTALSLCKELLAVLFKSNSEFKEKVEVAIYSKKVPKNTKSNLKENDVLALLFSVSDQESKGILFAEKTNERLEEKVILRQIIDSNELNISAKDKNKLTTLLSEKAYKKAWEYLWKQQQKKSVPKSTTKLALEKKLKEIFKDDTATAKLISELLVSKKIDTGDFQERISEAITLKDRQKSELLKLDKTIQTTLTQKEKRNLQKQLLKRGNNQKQVGGIIQEILKEDRNEVTNNQWAKLDDRLEYMLNLSNEKENSAEDIIQIDQLLKTPAKLRSFIRKNQNKPTSILLFTKITLGKAYAKQFEKMAYEINKDLSKIEKAVATLFASLAIAKIPSVTFQVFLRVEIIKSLVVKRFDTSEFTYGIIEKLRSMGMVDPFNKKLIGLNGNNRVENDIIDGLKAHYVNDGYQYIDKKVENEFYFDQLYAHLLKNKTLPFWSKNGSYTLSDAFGYLMMKVKKKQVSYLIDLLNNTVAKKEIALHFSKAPLDDQLQLLAVLEIEKSRPTTLEIYKAIAIRSIELQISLPKVIDFILSKDIWRISSTQYIAEKIIDVIAANDGDLKDALRQYLLDEKAPLITTKKSTEKSVVIKEAINYYSATKTIKEENVVSINDLKRALKTSTALLRNTLYENSTSVELIQNFTDLVSKNQFDELIKNYSAEVDKGLQVLANAIRTQLKKQTKASAAFVHLLALFSTALIAQNTFRKSILIRLFENSKNSPLNWEELAQEIQTELLQINKGSLSASDIIKIADIKSFIDSKNSKEKRDNEWAETINYYITFGALPANQEDKSPEVIFQNLTRLAKSKPLLWKIAFHNWSKRKKRLSHLLAIYPEKKQKELLMLIHPKLEKQLNLLLELIQNDGLIKPNKIVKSIEELVPEILEIWGKSFVSIAHLDDVLVPFILNYLPLKSIKDKDQIALLKEKEVSATGDKKEIMKLINQLIDENTVLKKEKPSNRKKLEISKEGIGITNAGLIMVWPFIATLFNKVGLTEKNKFIDDQSQQRAVLLTQYLIFFSTDFNEGDLILNKLLCGLQASDFVDTTLELSDYEKETAGMLLGAVINNWEKLSKTSVSTLQETFLQRNGIIQKHEKDTKLFVESKAYDLLLKTIPWNISMIQTTFMKSRLLVEWKY